MRLSKIISLIFVFSVSITSHASRKTKHTFTLRAGIGPSVTQLKTLHPENTPPAPGLGFISSVGYLWKSFELGITSYANISRPRRIRLQMQGTTIEGNSHYRSIALGPSVKHFSGLNPIGNFNFYTHAGFLVNQLTIKPKFVTLSGGKYHDVHKITAEGIGGFLGLGLAKMGKNSPQKIRSTLNDHIFVELVYKLLSADRLTEVGGTTTEVEAIATEDADEKVYEHSVLLSFGARFF